MNLPESKHIDREKHPPTLIGDNGAAWEIDFARVRGALGFKPAQDATVGMWFVFAPWAHPAWAYYLITVIHLRPMPNVPEAKLNLAGATHEVWVYALDPREEPNFDRPPRTSLNPANFVGQWIEEERSAIAEMDSSAHRKVLNCVHEILAGTLSPDTDYIHQWVERFSDSNLLR